MLGGSQQEDEDTALVAVSSYQNLRRKRFTTSQRETFPERKWFFHRVR